MEIGIKVGDIMTRNFISVNPETSLIECSRKMIKNRVGSLVLKEGQKLKGLLTERDIIWAMTKKHFSDLNKIKAKDIATRKVNIIKPSADLYAALQKMKKSKYRWLPVTSEGNVIGLLTIKDILRIEPSLFETAAELMQIREETEKLKRRGTFKPVKEEMCEECGNYSVLCKVDNRLICENCRDSM